MCIYMYMHVQAPIIKEQTYTFEGAILRPSSVNTVAPPLSTALICMHELCVCECVSHAV